MKGWIVFCSIAVIATPACAEERRTSVRGWYGGVSLAHDTYDLSVDDLNSYGFVVANPGETRVDNETLGYSLFAGFRPSRFFALEVGYADFGSINYHLGSRLGAPDPYCSFILQSAEAICAERLRVSGKWTICPGQTFFSNRQTLVYRPTLGLGVAHV